MQQKLLTKSFYQNTTSQVYQPEKRVRGIREVEIIAKLVTHDLQERYSQCKQNERKGERVNNSCRRKSNNGGGHENFPRNIKCMDTVSETTTITNSMILVGNIALHGMNTLLEEMSLRSL